MKYKKRSQVKQSYFWKQKLNNNLYECNSVFLLSSQWATICVGCIISNTHPMYVEGCSSESKIWGGMWSTSLDGEKTQGLRNEQVCVFEFYVYVFLHHVKMARCWWSHQEQWQGPKELVPCVLFHSKQRLS